MIWHLNPSGKAGIVLANGSMSSNTNNEGTVRRSLVEADLVECMVALPGQLFANTQIPACVWFLNRNKTRKEQVLFIDARNLGEMVSRVQKQYTKDDINRIADCFHAWQANDCYDDIPGFCKSATLEEIRKHDHVLTPGRYVGAADEVDDGIPFSDKMETLTATLKEQFAESARLEEQIRKNLEGLGYEC